MSVLYGTDHFPTPTPSPLIWPKSPHLVINTLINNVINAGKNVPSKDCIFWWFMIICKWTLWL